MRPYLLSLAFIALLIVGGSPAAWAQSVSGEITQKCGSGPSAPQIPNGRTATEEEMLSAQRTLKSYLADGDAFLACLQDVEEGWGEGVTDEQRSMLLVFHNQIVDKMQATADLFNQAVRAFKGKRGN